MKISDALSILGLSSGATNEEVRAAYKTAAKKYHPDINPAGAEMMKLVNAALDILKECTSSKTEEQTDENYGDVLNAALSAIIDLEGLDIEICGSWIWVSGETWTHKGALKAAGFRYASKKKKWNFRPTTWKSSSRGNWSMDEIRNRHGSARPARPLRPEFDALEERA